MSTTLTFSGSNLQFGQGAGKGGGALSASPAAGTSSVTLTGVSGATPSVGTVAWFNQCDTGWSGSVNAGGGGNTCNVGSYSDDGGVFVCGGSTTCNSNGSGSGGGGQASQMQHVLITSVTNNGGGSYTIGFSPGLYMANWSTARTAAMYWQSGSVGYGIGIEDLTIAINGQVIQGPAYASWIKGVRIVGAGGNRQLLFPFFGKNNLVANNYFYTVTPSSPSNSSAAIQNVQGSDDLFINNISEGQQFIEGAGTQTGEVIAYNFDINNDNTAPFASNTYEHDSFSSGVSFILNEGNQGEGWDDDDTWGTGNLNTTFRNWFQCSSPPYTYSSVTGFAVSVDAFHRFDNAIGNVLGGTAQCASYSGSANGNIYRINTQGTDTLAGTSLMRWYNYDTVTGTTRCQSSEVPTTLSGNAVPFQNTVPANCSAPASFYMGSMGFHPSGGTGLSWWKTCSSGFNASTGACGGSTTTPAFPAAGPDVTGGANVGGMVQSSPANIAWTSLPVDTSYQNSYTITGSSWSNNSGTCFPAPAPCEQLTVSGLPGGTRLMGRFQISGGACATTGAGTATGAEVTITHVSGSTVTYSLASNPGACTGTMLWPDVRQFDERVYATDATTAYSLTVTSAHGTVSGANCSTNSYASGAAIGACTATASTGYTFTGWSGTGSASGCVGTGTCGPFSLLADSTLTANYAINSYGLTTATVGPGSGTIVCTPSGTVNYNTPVSCTVTANAGSTISSVTGCGGTWTSSPYTFNMPAASCIATATFGLTTNTLTVSTAGLGSGTVSGTNCSSGTYSYGTTIGPCTATPTSGFFAGWTGTGDAASICSGTGTCGPFTLTQTTNLTATFSPAVATPTASPSTGSYAGTQSVTLSTTTSGATIYYTTDGSDPTPSSSVYSTPISVATSLTLKFYGVKSGYIDSHIGSAVYTINGTLAAPNFSPGAGTYSSAQTVTITATGSTIGTAINTMTETSNSSDTSGSAPHRNVYTNCIQTCSGGTPGPSPYGQLWCTASAKSTWSSSCPSFASAGVVSATLTSSMAVVMENGNGAGGSDSATSVTATYAAATSTGCPVGTNNASALVSGLTFPGETTNAQAVFGLTTGSNPNTSMLAVTKYNTNGDSGRYLARQDCASPNTASVTGQHYEWDTNYNTSGGTYFGFGMHYDFTTSKISVCPQGCSGWTAVELVPIGGGSTITTYSWPANDYLYSERYDYWDAGCSYASSTACAHYGQICLRLYNAGSPVNSLTCYNIQNASTHAQFSFTPLNKTSWTHPQYAPQHQWDINSTSKTLTATVEFDSLVAYSLSSSGTPTICYTTDGTTPTSSPAGTCSHGTTYTAPVVIGSTTTLKAIATAVGFTDSSVQSALYTISTTPGKATLSGTVKCQNCVIQ